MSFKTLYQKYVVESCVLYYVFVFAGVFFIIYLLINTKVSVVETFDGTYADNRLIINEPVLFTIDNVYIYKNRSDTIESYDVTDQEIIDTSYTTLYISQDGDNKSIENLDGMIKLEIEIGEASLLDIIIGTKKRYVEKDIR